MVNEIHTTASGFFEHKVLRLPLCSDEEDRAIVGCEASDKVFSLSRESLGLSEIYDVDAISLSENIRSHLRVPALSLVAEMYTGIQKVLQRQRRQATSIYLPLTELEAFTCSSESILLTFFTAGIASEHASGLQRASQFGVRLYECASDTKPKSACLPGDPTA